MVRLRHDHASAEPLAFNARSPGCEASTFTRNSFDCTDALLQMMSIRHGMLFSVTVVKLVNMHMTIPVTRNHLASAVSVFQCAYIQCKCVRPLGENLLAAFIRLCVLLSSLYFYNLYLGLDTHPG